MTYGELIGGKSFAMTLDHNKPVKDKDPKDYKIVGKPVRAVDIPDKVTGRFTYIQDFRVPGMLHGRVVRPAAIGATLESVDDSAGQEHSGHRQGGARGQLPRRRGANEWAAIQAAQALKATWSNSEALPEQAKLCEHVRATKVIKDEVTSNVGDTAEAMAKAGARVSRRPTTSPSTRTARSARPARWPNSRTAS